MRYGSDELLDGRLDMFVNQESTLQEPLQQFLSLLAVSFGGSTTTSARSSRCCARKEESSPDPLLLRCTSEAMAGG